MADRIISQGSHIWLPFLIINVMAEHIRIYIDFWNFQLEWNNRTGKKIINWADLPQLFIKEAIKITKINDYQYDGTKIYTSVHTSNPKERGLKNWLTSILDQQPGINVNIRKRRSMLKPVHCQFCDKDILECPLCKKPFERAVEKGVDAAIITDMFSLAWANAYNIAILTTSDGDYVPAVENLQSKGFKIINAAWKRKGYQLRGACWASFDIDDLIPTLASQ